MDADLPILLARVPAGYHEVRVDGRRWGLSRQDRANGASVTLHAEALDGSDVVSANAYRTRSGVVLRPCEMPAAKVLDFLRRQVPAQGPTPPTRSTA